MMTAQAGEIERDKASDVLGSVRPGIIVGICSLTLLLNNGFALIGVSIFDPLMITRLHVSVGALKFGDTIALLTLAALAPVAGYLIDKAGPRLMMVAGMLLMALGLVLYTVFTTIGLIYLTFVLFGMCLAFAGGFSCLLVVSDVTAKRRGLAIGVLLATASLGQAIAPSILSALQRIAGWKLALEGVALIVVCLIPVMLFIIPKRLQAIAAVPHGASPHVTLGASIKLKSFWGLATVGGIGYMAAIGVSTNMVIFLTKDLHLTTGKIGFLLFVQFSTALIAQLLTGYLCDLLNKRVMHAVCVGLMAAGCFCFGFERETLALVGVALFGVGWGGNYVLLQYLMTHLFSGPSVGRIVGLIAVVEALGGAAGPMAFGTSYDMTGSYSDAFLVVAVALLLTALVASQIRKAEVRWGTIEGTTISLPQRF
jgi:MFS family permease